MTEKDVINEILAMNKPYKHCKDEMKQQTFQANIKRFNEGTLSSKTLTKLFNNFGYVKVAEVTQWGKVAENV